MTLPTDLDVYAVLLMALNMPEYRDKLLFVVGVVFGLGFVLGVLTFAILTSPMLEMKGRRYEIEVERRDE